MKVIGTSWVNALLFILVLAISSSPATAQSSPKPSGLFTIIAEAPETIPETGYLRLGSRGAGKSPDGHVLSVNSRYLTRDSQPWLPVMGEFHYSRYPERYWEEEILKMKAGGVQIVSSYVFWIHQEEVEGQFDWSGQRNLRKFVELCAKHGMYVYPRIGPWVHGEARNGGFPDWLLEKGPSRENNLAYLSYVRRYYREIASQLKGLLWKDGGPVIGIQIENEYTNRAPNGGAAHISRLKALAMDAGLDVPLYTVTGWGNAPYPAREVIPVFGGYPDEPWSGSLQELPPDTQGVYQFHVATSGKTGILQDVPAPPVEHPLWHYPQFDAELGGGSQLTYHRRVVITENDIPPMVLTALGSGVNLLGYYMFQGGANPPGKLTTLQESQTTDYPNDVPVIAYDFQAPLREYGQMNESFRKLKVIHQFVQDFGSYLAPMTAVLPDIVPSGLGDITTLRVAARTRGNRGFIFFNNYLRHGPLPEQKNVQVVLKLPSESITLPRQPVSVPSQSAFFWPVNLNLNGALLKYATAQPFAKIDQGNVAYYFFMTTPGVMPEFALSAPTIAALKTKSGLVSRQGEGIYVAETTQASARAIDIRSHTGKSVRIVLLSPEQAENSWKILANGHEHLLITPADVFSDAGIIHLRSRAVNAFSFSIVPDIHNQFVAAVPLHKTLDDGIFAHYVASVESKQIQVVLKKVHDAGPSSPVKMGKAFDWRPGPVPQAPDDLEFEKAGVWRITLPEDVCRELADVFLNINYVGDVGRLYMGATLIDDNFFNGTAWGVGLKRFGSEALAKGLDLKILPLRKDSPIYMPKTSRPDFDGKSEIVEVESVTLSPEYEVTLSSQRDAPHSTHRVAPSPITAPPAH